MGTFDNIILPAEFDLPEFPANPRYDGDHDRLWQTKDLLCGQDRYRLRAFDDSEAGRGTHQLERRVPPLQKLTRSGNHFIGADAESDLLWWNIVRPTVDMRITDIVDNDMYEYELELYNGVLMDVRLVGITEDRFKTGPPPEADGDDS